MPTAHPHAPQLTLRALASGALLGGMLSLTSLYLGAKIGWIPSVGIIAGVLAFAVFRMVNRLGLGRELGLLENNLSQTVANGAAFMAAPLASSLGAYMVVTQTILPMGVAAVWMCTVALFGVLLALPLKRRFIDGGQYPFPEGQATAVVLEALHTGNHPQKTGALKAKILLVAAAVAGAIRLCTSQALLEKVRAGVLAIPQYLDDWIYNFAAPKILGVPLRELTVRMESDVVLIAVGGLMGLRTGVSLLLGAAVNYLVLAPLLIQHQHIHATPGSPGSQYGFAAIMMWSLWPGVALMASASLFPLLARPRAVLAALRGLWTRSLRAGDPARSPILMPNKVFLLGVFIVAAAVVFLARLAFNVPLWVTLAALPLVVVSTFLAVNATALTSVTPSGALAMLTQLGHGLVTPAQLGATIGTAALTSDASANASNLLMSLKSGRLLGASPGPQIWGHVAGVVVGTLVTIPVFWLVFLRPGLVTEQFPMPGVTMWAAVGRAMTLGLDDVEASARLAAVVGLVVGCLIEAAGLFSRRRWGLSGVGFGLAFVIPFSASLSLFLGALFFWLASRSFRNAGETLRQAFVVNAESVAAGAIAGGALVGVLVTVLETLLS